MGTFVPVLGGVATVAVVLAVARTVARSRPEREARSVFYAVLGLVGATALIAISARLMLSGSRGVGVFGGLLAMVCIVVASRSFLELHAVRSEEAGSDSQSKSD